MPEIDKNVKILSSHSWKNWRAVQFLSGFDKPHTFKEWFWYIWGWDIFMNNVPILKIIILANVLVWIVLSIALFY